MLYPKRFDSANAHRLRVKALRDVTQWTKEVLAAQNPMLYVKFDRPGNRSMYVVDFGCGPISLEKWQVELFLLGVTAGLAVTEQASRIKIKEWVELVAAPTEDGQPPRPWGVTEPAEPAAPPAATATPNGSTKAAKRTAKRAPKRDVSAAM